MRGLRFRTIVTGLSPFLRLFSGVIALSRATPSFRPGNCRVSSLLMLRALCSVYLITAGLADAIADAAPAAMLYASPQLAGAPSVGGRRAITAVDASPPPAAVRTGAAIASHPKRNGENTPNGANAAGQDSQRDSSPMMRDPGPERDNMPIKRPPKSATQDRMVHDRVGRDAIAR
jgi:hypothetical protein